MEEYWGRIQGEDGRFEKGVYWWFCDDEKWNALGENISDGQAN